MRMIWHGAIQFVFWSAFYAMLGQLKTEPAILAAFVFTLVVSMTTACVFLVRPRG